MMGIQQIQYLLEREEIEELLEETEEQSVIENVVAELEGEFKPLKERR